MGTDRNRRKTESRWRVGSGGHCFGMGPFSPVALTGVDELIEWGHSLHIYMLAYARVVTWPVRSFPLGAKSRVDG